MVQYLKSRGHETCRTVLTLVGRQADKGLLKGAEHLKDTESDLCTTFAEDYLTVRTHELASSTRCSLHGAVCTQSPTDAGAASGSRLFNRGGQRAAPYIHELYVVYGKH